MIVEIGVVDDPELVGFYSGLVVRSLPFVRYRLLRGTIDAYNFF